MIHNRIEFKLAILTLIASLIPLTYSNCKYIPMSGIPLPVLNNSYCNQIIQWPVSSQTLLTYQNRDSIAQANYTQLYTQYYQNNSVDLACMGMARYFFCAQAYPTCVQGQDTLEGVCQWLCDLWTIRCGQNNIFYQQMCLSNGGDANCSYAGNMAITLLSLLLFIFLLY